MKKINVIWACLCSLFLFTGCYTNEFGDNQFVDNGEPDVSKDGAIETLKEVANFVDEQTDLEINAFQTNLLTWLKDNKNVKEATIGENKDLITVKLKNGYDFYINFQDMAIFYNDENEQISVPRSKIIGLWEDYYDVSYQDGEKIIEKNKILYIQGIDMFDSYADDEKKDFIDLISKSPVDNELVTVSKSLLFLDENFSDYGIIIVAQTHGYEFYKDNEKRTGAFYIEDRNIDFSEKTEFSNNNKTEFSNNNIDAQLLANNRALAIYRVNANRFIKAEDRTKSVFLINPELISLKMAKNENPIFFGNYCWSYGMADFLQNTTVYGNKTRARYNKQGRDYLRLFLIKMLNGLTYEKTYTYIKEPYSFLNLKDDGVEYIETEPNTNNPNSKQRYFSISTDTIELNEKGQPIIKGKINGYNNLKKEELTYLVYFHEGDEDFSPELDLDDAEYINITPNIESDGKFSFDFPESLKANTKYRMAFAFKYKDAIYYGERKTVKTKEEDIRAYLEKLYHDTDGKHWTRNDNWLSKDIPIERWYGVTLWGGLRIDLDNNNLNGSIDLSGCSSLKRFSCKNNNLESIDVSGTAIETLNYCNNNLQSLNVSECTALRELYCYDNNLASLDASGCTALKRLDCYDNNLTSLNVSGCTALWQLKCSRNSLTSLNVSGCTALYDLSCSDNNLDSLNVLGCTELVMLSCENNHIKSEVPQDFDKLWIFEHDQLYNYYYDYELSKTTYKENKYGWFYPGEPESLYHGRLSSPNAPRRQTKKK